MLVIVFWAVSICGVYGSRSLIIHIIQVVLIFKEWDLPHECNQTDLNMQRIHPHTTNPLIMLRWTTGLICHNIESGPAIILYAFWCFASYFKDFFFFFFVVSFSSFGRYSVFKYSDHLAMFSESESIVIMNTSICRHTIMVNTKWNKSKMSEWMNQMKIERVRRRRGNRDGYIFGHEISCVCAPKIDRHMHSENRINTFIKLYGVNGTRGQDMNADTKTTITTLLFTAV